MTTTSELRAPSRRRLAWRTVDIVVAAVVAVASGLIFWGFGAVYDAPAGALTLVTPGFEGLANGPFLFAGVLGGLIVRKPGAAVFTELVAAVVEALAGSHWGLSVLLSGAVQGLGAEIVFALLAYRAFGPVAALLAGAGAGVGESIVDVIVGYLGRGPVVIGVYAVTTIVSGAVFGLLSWLLVRALAATGALDRFGAGRAARRAV